MDTFTRIILVSAWQNQYCPICWNRFHR